MVVVWSGLGAWGWVVVGGWGAPWTKPRCVEKWSVTRGGEPGSTDAGTGSTRWEGGGGGKVENGVEGITLGRGHHLEGSLVVQLE